MGCLGVFFALSKSQEKTFLSVQNDDELMEHIEEIEENWDENWLYQIDKAWDALHRSLTDGTLDSGDGNNPLDGAVLGGIQLNKGEDYFVIFKSSSQCNAIAQELFSTSRAQIRKGYDRINPEDYDFPLNEEFEYIWEELKGLKEFYKEAAKDERSVIFTVSQ